MTEPAATGVEKISRTRSELREWKDRDGTFLGWEGVVWTPHGAVVVISSVRSGKILYRLASAGRLYRRYVFGATASRYVLARDARRFAETVIHTNR